MPSLPYISLEKNPAISLEHVTEKALRASRRHDGAPVHFIFNDIAVVLDAQTSAINVKMFHALAVMRRNRNLETPPFLLPATGIFQQIGMPQSGFFAHAKMARAQARDLTGFVSFLFHAPDLHRHIAMANDTETDMLHALVATMFISERIRREEERIIAGLLPCLPAARCPA